MMWVGWIIAVIAIAAAVWLARLLAIERATTTQLRFAKIEAENATDAMRANQAQAVGASGLAPLGKLLGATAHELDAPLASVRSQVDHAARQLVDYRTLVKRYDAAVQYCLQPVELIFGADKASLDKLVLHVENARRALFEARGNLEKSSALDESRHLLETAAESLRDIGALTQSLAQFGGTDQGEPQAVDVNLSLDHALRIAERRLRGRIEIVRDYRELPKIQAGPNELAQVFLHLINNASEAMDSAGKLSVATRPAGQNVEIDVGDTGAGISEDMLPAIFEPFVTTKSAAAGGIGLTVVRQIVNGLGGSVKVRSRLGAGSVFTVVLPVNSATGRRE